MRNFMTRLFFGLAMLAAPTLSTFSGSSAFAAQAAVVPGQLAPDFEITLANGRSGHLSDFRGRVVVLDFWASWCSWCRMELPQVDRINRNYNNVVVIGIDNEDSATITAATQAFGLSFTTLHDNNGAVSSMFGADSIPFSIVIDANGYVSYVIRGYHADNTLARAVLQALAG